MNVHSAHHHPLHPPLVIRDPMHEKAYPGKGYEEGYGRNEHALPRPVGNGGADQVTQPRQLQHHQQHDDNQADERKQESSAAFGHTSSIGTLRGCPEQVGGAHQARRPTGLWKAATLLDRPSRHLRLITDLRDGRRLLLLYKILESVELYAKALHIHSKSGEFVYSRFKTVCTSLKILNLRLICGQTATFYHQHRK